MSLIPREVVKNLDLVYVVGSSGFQDITSLKLGNRVLTPNQVRVMGVVLDNNPQVQYLL